MWKNGKLWSDNSFCFFCSNNKFKQIATTRHETIFVDAEVAVQPDDKRYSHMIWRNVVVPLIDRVVPIISDVYADPKKGSGCRKNHVCTWL